jgi:hypothetical protein
MVGICRFCTRKLFCQRSVLCLLLVNVTFPYNAVKLFIIEIYNVVHDKWLVCPIYCIVFFIDALKRTII